MRSACESLSFISCRETIMSTMPCSSRYSERWNPSGSCWRIVCSITRGPAKPMSALGSATLRSPSIAKLAVTPPVVGSVSTDTNGMPAFLSFASAALLFAICIRERILSCILAPPDEENTSTGAFFSRPSSIARVTFSPTTEPMLPPRNPKSKTATTTSWPFIRPEPVTMASPPPLFLTAALIRSTYFFESLNLRKSTEVIPASVSAKVPSSITRSILSRALIRK